MIRPEDVPFVPHWYNRTRTLARIHYQLDLVYHYMLGYRKTDPLDRPRRLPWYCRAFRWICNVPFGRLPCGCPRPR